MIPNCNWGIETDFLGTPEVVAHQQWHEDEWEKQKKMTRHNVDFGNDFGYRNKETNKMDMNAVATKASYSQMLNEEISNLFSVFSDLEVRIGYVLSEDNPNKGAAESSNPMAMSSPFVNEMGNLLDRLRGFNARIRETTERVCL